MVAQNQRGQIMTGQEIQLRLAVSIFTEGPLNLEMIAPAT
jgi:hypothetical protein